VSLLRWTILAVIFLLLTPYVLAFFENPRAYVVTSYALRYQEQLVRLAAPRLQRMCPPELQARIAPTGS
jgi:hypothetical protein